MIRSRLTGILVVAALALTATACGSDSDGGSDSTSKPGSSEDWSGTEPNAKPMSDADAAKVDDALASAFEKSEGLTPAVWMGVWDPDDGMHLAAAGEATTPDVDATTDDHFRIGSNTKTVTAAAILVEVDEGDLALDDTIADELPDLAKDHPEIADITMEQLLGMTSGIPDYANTPTIIPRVVDEPTKVWSAAEIIDLTLEEQPLADPGTPGYSTTNYLILGEVLEALNGDPAEDQLTAFVEEVGLSSTGFTPDGDETMPAPASSGYVNEPGVLALSSLEVELEAGTDVTDWTTTWGRAGGGMYSDLADLGAWAASGFGSNQLSKELGDQRISSTKELPEAPAYGLGIIVFDDGWIGHTGQILGWESIALYNPETGAVVVGATNETGSLPTVIAAIRVAVPELDPVLS